MGKTDGIVTRCIDEARDELSEFTNGRAFTPGNFGVFHDRVQRILESLTEAVEALAEDRINRRDDAEPAR